MVPVFDGHNDALTREDYAGIATGRPEGHLDLPRMRAGGVRGGMFAVFSPSPGAEGWVDVPRDDGVREFEYAEPLDHAAAAAHASAAAGRLLALERAGDVRVARSIGDFDATFADDADPPLAVLHLEGAEAIDTSLEALDTWYAAGLRSLGPVWSRANDFGEGVPFIFPSSPDTGLGLTGAGRRLVERCAELGILVDLSHMNEAGFWDVARLQAGPLVATHSAAHALCPSSRGMTNRQLDAIGESGGLIGIIYGVAFTRPDMEDNADTPLSVIADHARYVAERIGVEHVALGSDFDGTTIPDALGDVAGVPRLLDALSEAGFDERELEAIAWRNWRRVLATWWSG
ncbi:MAG TPA: dipeptidase [Solirubrobacteraceae bacterium]|nr:dipeptidase [Solirubrobacteraceae bacterium]